MKEYRKVGNEGGREREKYEEEEDKYEEKS